METRLDRLFTLLDTGSTPVIRRSAAAQLGDIQKLHPHKLRYLLNKILNLMRSKNWDTRVAAGHAIEAIAKNLPMKNDRVKDGDPTPITKDEAMDMIPAAPDSKIEPAPSVLSRFDVTVVLRDSASLLSADEEQFEMMPSVGLDDTEVIQRQKLLLNKKLGLEGPAGEGLELFNEDDLRTVQAEAPVTKQKHLTKQAKEIIDQQLNTEGMSIREISVAKRKARLELKRQVSNGSSASAPVDKKVKTASVAVEQPGQPDKILLDTVADGFEEESDDVWPFLEFCEILCNELFSKVWEMRHGAATLLREIVKQCGYSSGVSNPGMGSEENRLWLENLSVRLICVLALDRFADYISDEVVAPVRETCAQTLGTVCRYLTPADVQSIVLKLSEIINHPTWEVRYGSVLGLKYVIAVRQDLVNEMGSVWSLILNSIVDTVDDVRAVASTCLLPVVDKLPTIIPDRVDDLVKFLWDALLDLDDLTSSTHSMMTLLSALLTVDRMKRFKGPVLVELVPRIWPFLSHNISSVRKSSLKMLHTVFTECTDSCWLTPILIPMMRHIYQRCLIETLPSISDLSEKVWCSLMSRLSPDILQQQALPWLSTWISLLTNPAHIPIDNNLIIIASHQRSMNDNRTDQAAAAATTQLHHISGPIQDKPQVRAEKVVYSRLLCSRCIAKFLACVPLHLPDNRNILMDIIRLLELYLRSRSGTHRLCASLIISYWIQYAQDKNQVPVVEYLTNILLYCAEESLYYDEVAMLFTRLQTECKDFIACLKQQKASVEEHYPPGTLFTIERATELTTIHYPAVKSTLRKQVEEKFDSHSASLMLTVKQLKEDYGSLNMRVQMSIACALISLKILPPKLNPVIRPLMETIKKENYYYFQHLSSSKLCTVLSLCVDRQPCPNGKVFKNLCTALCANVALTPIADCVKYEADDSSGLACNVQNGIISLFTEGKNSETTSGAKRGPKSKKSNSASNHSNQDSEASQEHTNRLALTEDNIQFEGSRNAIYTIVHTLGENLLTTIPTCTEHFYKPLLHAKDDDIIPQTLVNVLQVLQVVYDVLPAQMKDDVLANFDKILLCIKSEFSAVRHMAAKAVAALTLSKTGEYMNHILDDVLPLLGASHLTCWRQGAIETIYHIVEGLSVKCIPYLVLMVVPVLGRMTDQNLSVQMMASQCFASLIKLMPLEGGVPDPPEMKKHLLEKKLQERQFLDQLLNGTILQSYGIPIPIKADLRKYQQDGVNWLAFLNKYKLHGILCDDMGLGKTLQTICILAGDHHIRQQKYQETGDIESVMLPSLVVCPSTLCGHWVYEVEKFVDKKHLHALNYSISPTERVRLRDEIQNYSLVVASYEIVRNDIEYLKTLHWNYCVLDEGHIIKNAKSKTTQAVKKLNCNHRLILTGTPVQNNVLELWSLIDFLMPGYLGTERQFSQRYSRPILQSRDARSSSKEQEAGALAVESLHKQVLPFLMRRLKSDVLQDLPPKIIQDYYCDLSPLQAQLYREFGQSSAGHVVERSLVSMKDDTQEQVGVKGHIFQALQYLKKVCNHPALVINNSKHPHHEKMIRECKSRGKSITDIEYSAKLASLKQLLLDCGIGVQASDVGVTGVVNQHRALVFCQLKMMIDIIESELLKKCLPSVTYLRLDGSTPSNSRHNLVNRFNDDPSIDLLLLTTTVGGLGLNLTGADTVIFVEHDWNPMKDLQAMDRAHRIGQTKVVNVYRLITRNTLEEKIMGLQKFKLNIANTIVNQENASLTTMGTDQLLDLFSLEEHKEKDIAPGSSPSKGLKAMLQNMTEVWDESEYENEYDVTNFLESLGKK